MSNLIAFFIFLFATVSIIPQSVEKKAIAIVGSYEITSDEFIERYELTPNVNAELTGAELALKNELLYSIIAEKLWAVEAEEMGLTNSKLITSTYKAIEKMYVRDALYREEILSKVNLSDEYLFEAFHRNSMILKLNYLFSVNEMEINQLYDQLNNEFQFQSLLINRPEFKLQKEPYIVEYGQMDKNVEDILYKLIEGEYTRPIKAPNGWYIFKLLTIEEKIIESVEQSEAEQKNVIRIAEATIMDSIYSDVYKIYFAEADVDTNGQIFATLSELVTDALKNRSETDNIKAGEKIYLKPDDLYKIENELGTDLLNAEFIKMGNEPATLDDFLQELAFESFSVDTLDNNLITNKLNSSVKKFIEHELLAREGYRRRLQNLPEVQRYLNIWRSYYLTETLRRKISEDIQVTDVEALEFYNQNIMDTSSLLEVKIVELLSDDLDIIRIVLDDLKTGADFKTLAIRFTIREEAKRNNGELGFFSINEYGEIGRIASTMKIGDMFGPVKVPEGYSLFELIDKKEERNLSIPEFETAKEKIKIEIKYKKFSDEIINKTVELANKYNVSIDEEILQSIKVLNTTTVVYRYFGFGGRLLAVPLTQSNYLWVKPWKEQTEMNP